MVPEQVALAKRRAESSDEEPEKPVAKRQKLHKFKKFAERVKDVDVDVYRSLAPKRSEPLAGSSSFFHERLTAWRELNAARDWLEAASALTPLCHTMPQLLHHQTEILDILLQRITLDAVLSMDALLDLIAALARDLQADFLPHLDRVLRVLSDFVEAGAHREPEILEHVFTCVSMLCKHLCKLLTPNLIPILSASTRLRYHRARHVRALAAQSFGYLLRHASPASQRIAVKTILADAVTKPSIARTHGAAACIAEAAAGAGHGLHSRTPALLGLLLQRDILSTKDFQGKKGGVGALSSADNIEARVTAVADECLQILLNHIRRGPEVTPLWDVVQDAVEERLDAFVAASSAAVLVNDALDAGGRKKGSTAATTKSPNTLSKKSKPKEPTLGAAAAQDDAAWAAARGVALLSSMVEYYRGSRVQSYTQLFELAHRLAGPEICIQAAAEPQKPRGHPSTIETPEAEQGEEDEVAPFIKFQQPSLSGQSLRFLQALTYSHCKAVGASEGPAAIERAAPLWAGVFARAPPGEVLAFVRALISPPAGAEVSRFFAPQMLAVVGRCLLQGTMEDVCWPLLMDLCTVLGSNAGAGNGMPIVLTASSGIGPKLAQLVSRTAASATSSASHAELQAAWAALHCLPHAVAKPEYAAQQLQSIADATAAAAAPGAGAGAESAFLVHCAARRVLARIAPPEMCNVDGALRFLEQHPQRYHAVRAAAETLKRYPDGAQPQDLEILAPLLAPNLSSPSATLRRDTLRVLCALPQPAMVAPAGADMRDIQPRCDALAQLLGIEDRPLGADSGRPAVVALGRIRNYFEYKRVPEVLVPAVVRGLLGVLSIRFSALWDAAASALAAALDSHPLVAWPLIFEHLEAAQEIFLKGENRVHGGKLSDPLLAAHKPAAAQASPLEHKEVLLEARFSAAGEEGIADALSGSTDATVRLTHLLRALAGANNNVIESKAKDWAPVFLSYSAAKTPDGVAGGDDEEEKDDTAEAEIDIDTPTTDTPIDEAQRELLVSGERERRTSGISLRSWRAGLREWLALMAGLKGMRSSAHNDALRRAVASHVMDSDPPVQQAALKCLRAFKLPWLAPYLDRLLRLADNHTLRAELAAFPLALQPTSLREGDDGVQKEHREELVPLLVALLFPKMRKRSGRLGGKGAPGSARSAILNFLSAAEPEELRPVLELFLGPLGHVFKHPVSPQDTSTLPEQHHQHDLGIAGVEWWAQCLGRKDGAFWLETIDAQSLNAQPLRRRIGYLNALEDLLQHLGHRMESYLPELLALAVTLLEGAVTAEGEDGAKEVRARCLRLTAEVLERFPAAASYGFMWQRLLTAAAPLMERIALEASADKPPPLVQLCVALTAAPQLISVIADGQGSIIGTEHGTIEPCLQPWAARDHLGSTLLARCIGALSAPTCAEPTRTAMLDALEQIFDTQDPLPELILREHTPLLLSGLQAIAIGVWRSGNSGDQGRSRGGRPGVKGQGQTRTAPRRATAARALAILELVGGRTSDWTTAAQLTDALLPLLQTNGGGAKGKRRIDEELIGRSLAALTALWSRLAAQFSPEHIKEQRDRLRRVATAMAPLAGVLSSRDARHALCACFATVAALLPDELADADALLTGLNAMSTTEVDEADYELRMAAYGKLTREKWGELSVLAGAPIIQHCARDLRNGDDLALRHAAAQALSHLISAAEARLQEAGDSIDDGGEVLELVQKILMPQIRRSVANSSLAVRQEHLALVRRVALALPQLHPDLQPLTNVNEETDFWLNIAHLQLHRRARAMARLARLLRGGNPPAPSTEHTRGAAPLSVGILVGLIFPLLQQTIVEGKVADDGGHEAKQIDVDRSANVVDAAVEALGAAASTLQWTQYQQLLGQYLRLMARHGDGAAAKPVLRAVCALLDSFHFLGSDQIEANGQEAHIEGAQDADAIEQDEEEEDIQMDENLLATNTLSTKYAPPPRDEVFRFLASRVVPELRDQLVSGENVRAPVAHALIKVLKLLPEARMRIELPRTLQLVANLLKLRLQRLRDDARAVLVKMTAELGPEYLPFAIEVLRSALPDKGYTAHVLGYTLHSVLEGVAPVAAEQPGCIDDCLPMILPIIEKDLFGDVSEAKEVQAFAASYKEAKRCRANDTFKLLASLVTFGTHLPLLLAPIRQRLSQASQPKVRTKLSNLLQHASRGVLANRTASAKDICELVYAVATAGLNAEEAQKEKAREASGAATLSKKDGSEDAAAPDAGRSALHQHVLVEFVLTTFYSAMKKGLVPIKGEGAGAQLDPILPLLVRALRSRHTPSVTSALQSLTLLIQADLQLPGLGRASSEAGKAVTDLLKRCPKTTHPIAQDCFRLLAGMLRRCERYAPSQAQLRFLLGWAFTDLEESAERQSAFALLRAILARKLVLPEVYDLMTRVQELVVRSQAAQVRQLAASALLQFLLDYPLGTDRLKQHLQFLLANLGYEHESGREAALDMLAAVLQKFPDQLITDWAETLFLPLVTRLVNDPSSKCRTSVAGCVATLLRRAAPPRRDRLAVYCLQWMQGGDARLVRAAAQTMGILVEVEGASVARRLPEILPLIAHVLRTRADLDAAADADDEAGLGREDIAALSEDVAPGWQEAYYGITLLEKALTAAPKHLFWASNTPAQDCWTAAQRLLLHRHVWVRKAAGRVVGSGLADPAIGPPMLAAGGDRASGALALAFFRQLDSPAADEAMAGQAVKCLVFLSSLMYDADLAAGRVPRATATTQHGDAREGGSAHGNGNGHHQTVGNGTSVSVRPVRNSTQEPSAVASDEGEDDEEEERGEVEAVGALSLEGLIRRVVRLADDKSFVRQIHRGTALRFIAAVSSRLGPSKIAPYLPALLRPLYRITEPGATGNPDEVRALADEIVAHLRTLVGADALLAAYNTARESVRKQRGERKQRAAVQAMVDPEAAAKRKLRASARKSVGKRKAMEEVRRKRAAGIVVKNKGAPAYKKERR